MNIKKYKKILQTVIDSKGSSCFGSRDECKKCPVDCTDLDYDDHYLRVEKWMKEIK